jgi:Fe-S-cluster-containing hydrogenase component 2
MGALVIDASQRTREHLTARCIGCGLCVVACGGRKALVMEPVPHYKLPYRSNFAYQLQATTTMLKNAWSVWRRR